MLEKLGRYGRYIACAPGDPAQPFELTLVNERDAWGYIPLLVERVILAMMRCIIW